ncbi:ABC transporter permease [Entomospira culicis]|uniref:ABC transporter permease n=1 Tax=Entomospira culicis TaxID=2719989 RepID=A0A968GDM5_9SPIO|nr:ABC transporter permease [Entomospira culicis]NIZ18397.1 ABC transporter permease [Entomospira culicis]NIZ68613.1 ABC transporter permease [Entomospira culicis]WDI37213.1 ABC transporter permease [Entomospira culicis]WDI38841.1 ABC transporter permease [Entomospira culicis]
MKHANRWLFLTRRLCYTCFLALLAVVSLFVVFSVIPGDAALLSVGVEADELLLATLRTEMGLDRSLWIRFVDWLARAMQGDLGISTRYKEPVVDLIARHAGVTLRLTLVSMSLTIGFSFIIASFVMILRRRTVITWVIWLSQIFLAIPQFWLGMMVIQIFSIKLGWFSLFYLELDWRDYFAPALVLAFVQSAYLARYLISSWQREIRQRYVVSGLARGLSERRLRFGHALRGSLTSTVMMLGLIWIDLLSGSIIIEMLFMLPGLGQLLINAVSARDLPLVQGITLYFVLMVSISNMVLEVILYKLNPRAQQAVGDGATV